MRIRLLIGFESGETRGGGGGGEEKGGVGQGGGEGVGMLVILTIYGPMCYK